MTIAWVLGSRGLLGAALCRVLLRKGTELYLPSDRFCWGDEPAVRAQIAAALHAFSARVGPADRWEIYWAAGVGTMGSGEDELGMETRVLALLLDLVGSDARLVGGFLGGVAFASSAGAIYAGSFGEIITENTRPAPTTAYAREKLKQEELVSAFAAANGRVRALVARLSTLYGPGQSYGKQQGLLAHIARSILRNRPIQIFVPFDTIRDYICSDDAASGMVNSLAAIGVSARFVTRIIASEHPVTIAEVISIFKRLARRGPRIVTSANKLSHLYSRRVQFRSVVKTELPKPEGTSLLIGIARLMEAERAAYAHGPASRPTINGQM